DWRHGDTVGPVSLEATRAVREPGTEVSATEIGGKARGPRGRWAIGLHRVRRPVPEHLGEGAPESSDVTTTNESTDGPGKEPRAPSR
ncbi:MAG: SGNH/GDSL hydrolase family protein, partial [Actinomycetota bacterium]|nr:SGNH/GDSL hydrolase family protein [Actinomycetota bacterium]